MHDTVSHYYQCDTTLLMTGQQLQLVTAYTQLQEYSVYIPQIDVPTSTSAPAATQGAALIPSMTTSLQSIASASSTTASSQCCQRIGCGSIHVDIHLN